MSQLIVILPDQQIPHHDTKLHKLVLRWLREHRPSRIVHSGDLIDFRSLAKYDWNPKMDPQPLASLRHDLDAARQYIDECAEAAQAEAVDWIEGNHEARLRKYIIQKADRLACLPELSIESLFRLSNAGINYVPDWPHGKLWLSPKLAVMHGRLARKRSGQTALATLEATGHSVIVGHTHRLAMVFHTQHPFKGAETRVAIEAGTLARVKGGLGYAPDPDWQNGFVAVRLYQDGGFHCSLATYVRGVLRYEGEEYR